jgi:hypothetical protein
VARDSGHWLSSVLRSRITYRCARGESGGARVPPHLHCLGFELVILLISVFALPADVWEGWTPTIR